jgi:hypothetical protein
MITRLLQILVPVGIIIVIFLALYGVILREQDKGPHDYDVDEDDYDEDDYDDYEREDEFPEPAVDIAEPAVDIAPTPTYGPETFEIADMTLRLTKPHLFADNWYETSYREYSLHAVKHAQDRAAFIDLIAQPVHGMVMHLAA